MLKELEVLSTWYMVNDRGALVPAKDENHYFFSMEKYFATVSISPHIDPDTRALYFDINDFKKIEQALLSIFT